jgi:hypothetical protein
MLNDLALAHEDEEDELRDGDEEEEEERRQEAEAAPCAKLDATCAKNAVMGMLACRASNTSIQAASMMTESFSLLPAWRCHQGEDVDDHRLMIIFCTTDSLTPTSTSTSTHPHIHASTHPHIDSISPAFLLAPLLSLSWRETEGLVPSPPRGIIWDHSTGVSTGRHTEKL